MADFEVSVVPKGQMDSIQHTLDQMRRELQDIKKNYQPVTPEEWLTRTESSKLLKINLSTLWAWTKKGRLQSYHLCGKVYYKRSQIESMITAS